MDFIFKQNETKPNPHPIRKNDSSVICIDRLLCVEWNYLAEGWCIIPIHQLTMKFSTVAKKKKPFLINISKDFK